MSSDAAALLVVDQPTFDKIECNRCGHCCERFYISGGKGPLELLTDLLTRVVEEKGTYGPQDGVLWLGQLTPTWDDEKQMFSYSCGYFTRDEGGQGVCTIHDTRPEMCRNFPYGRPVVADEWPDCSWRVELVDFEVVQRDPCEDDPAP